MVGASGLTSGPARRSAIPPGGRRRLIGACIETTDKILAGRPELAALERQRRMFGQAPSFACMLGGPAHVFEFVRCAGQARAFRAYDRRSINLCDATIAAC